MNPEKLLRCIVTCDTLGSPRGDTVFFCESKARLLASIGKIKVVDKDGLFKMAYDNLAYLSRKKFSNRGLPKIAWVQCYSKNGGAEISNFNLVKAGESFGFDIVGVSLNEPIKKDIIESSDLIIVNNVHSCEGHEWIIKYLMNTKKPWIKYDHDCCETEFNLYKKSTMNVFISPKHMEFYVSHCGEEIKSKSICLPLAFDVDRFRNENSKRVLGTVYVPTYQKSREALQGYLRKNKGVKVYVADSAIPVDTYSVEKKEYTEMPEEYLKYEYVFHCPSHLCAGERILFEAVLSGCKVITNENAGHSSWHFNWKDNDVLREVLPQALRGFWKTVQNILTPVVASQKKTISIVTRMMGRKQYLKQTLPTWLMLPNIDKIIIVDWGMVEDLTDLLTDDRIVIVQVPGKTKFDQGEIWNVGARYCKSDFMFMVDSEVICNVNSSPLYKIFINVMDGRYSEKDFLIVDGTRAGGITGTSIISKSMFDKVNGFCEGLKLRGYDEIDLRNRVVKSGGTLKKVFYHGMLSHIEHDNASRFTYMDTVENIIESDKKNMEAILKIDVYKQKRVPVKCNIVSKSGTVEGVMV